MTIVATFRYIVATLNVIVATFGFNVATFNVIVATNQIPPNSQA
jgi:hypothetical protein